MLVLLSEPPGERENLAFADSPQITLQKTPRRRYNQRRAGVDRTRQRGLGLGTQSLLA